MRALILALLCLAGMARATPRSSAAIAEFKRLHPCPATGQPRGACPGWIVDHIQPLCAGGADAPSNMQWQTIRDAREKDRDEHATCRAQRRRQ